MHTHIVLYIAVFVFRGTHHNAEDVEECCRDTLKNLKLDYLDLYLVCMYIVYALK